MPAKEPPWESVHQSKQEMAQLEIQLVVVVV